MTARKSAGPRGFKPAAGYMFKKDPKTGKFKTRQVFKIQPSQLKYHKALKGGVKARVIVASKHRDAISGKMVYKLMHTTDAHKNHGWTRVKKPLGSVSPSKALRIMKSKSKSKYSKK